MHYRLFFLGLAAGLGVAVAGCSSDDAAGPFDAGADVTTADSGAEGGHPTPSDAAMDATALADSGDGDAAPLDDGAGGGDAADSSNLDGGAGGDASDGDASDGEASDADASGQDAGPATGPVTMNTTLVGAPEPGVLVVFQDSQGAVLTYGTTDGAGAFTSVVPSGSQVTVIFNHGDSVRFETVTALTPGDVLTAADPGVPRFATLDVNALPSDPPPG
ncbi:MAG TPA: hypothetical protein VGI39_30550, partial [Polyangiaceae bacterium]